VKPRQNQAQSPNMIGIDATDGAVSEQPLQTTVLEVADRERMIPDA
jgi:hypothetical protein